jgi:protein-tyrosine phosphatase
MDADWLLPGRLLLASRPAYPGYPGTPDYPLRYRHGLALLADFGVGVVWTFLADPDLERYGLEHWAEDLADLGIVLRRSPIADFGAPTPTQVADFTAQLLHDLETGPVALSCSAGLGRTGTMAACFLVSQGWSDREAITEVRRCRPGAVETSAQEALVTSYARRIRAAIAPPPPPDTATAGGNGRVPG